MFVKVVLSSNVLYAVSFEFFFNTSIRLAALTKTKNCFITLTFIFENSVICVLIDWVNFFWPTTQNGRIAASPPLLLQCMVCNQFWPLLHHRSPWVLGAFRTLWAPSTSIGNNLTLAHIYRHCWRVWKWPQTMLPPGKNRRNSIWHVP